MTKKTRLFLFCSLVFLFLAAAPLTILYSLGWRIDWQTRKIIQPGIFYFRVWPKSAEIYINGQLKKKTNFFFDSALIENLRPKRYEVAVKKDGYFSWEKNLEIKERQVTEAKNVVLIPKEPGFSILSKDAEEFFVSPDENKIIFKEKEQNSSDNAQNPSWSLKLFETDKKVKSPLAAEKDFLPKRVSKKSPAGQKIEAQLNSLTFSADSKNALLEVVSGEELKYFILELDKTPSLLIPLDFFPSKFQIDRIYFAPKDSQKIVILSQGKLYEADLLSKQIQLLQNPDQKEILAAVFSNNDIYYLNDSGFVFKTDLSFSSKDKINSAPVSITEETKYDISFVNSYLFLEENDSLHIFNKDEKSFDKIFDTAKGFELSPDSKKLMYFGNNEIWVLFLEKIYTQPQREAGDKLFITRFSEEIGDVFWYADNYLIFNVGNKIKVSEIDDRDKLNIVDLADFNKPKFIWAESDKSAYLLSEGNLFSSEKLNR